MAYSLNEFSISQPTHNQWDFYIYVSSRKCLQPLLQAQAVGQSWNDCKAVLGRFFWMQGRAVSRQWREESGLHKDGKLQLQSDPNDAASKNRSDQQTCLLLQIKRDKTCGPITTCCDLSQVLSC